MKLVINTAHQRFGGATQVALSFINECKNFSEHEYHVWIGHGLHKLIDKRDFPQNYFFYNFDFGRIDFKAIKSIQATLRKYENKIMPDIIISSSGPTYYHSIAPQIMGFNLPRYIYPESPYVHDMGPVRKLRHFLKKKAHYYYYKRDATALVTQTDDVNQRVRKALKTNHVYTVTNTANSFFNNPKILEKKLPKKKKNTFRFITVTTYYGHKNLDLIPEVLSELKQRGYENIEFVLTLKDSDLKEYIGLHDKILNVGPIKPQECPSLYSECDALFLPTLAECFSASYPEAMIMKKPIVTTNFGFATSVCGEAALYFDPKNAKSAADQIIKLVDNEILQSRLIELGEQQLKKFDEPKQRAEKYLSICKKYALNTKKN